MRTEAEILAEIEFINEVFKTIEAFMQIAISENNMDELSSLALSKRYYTGRLESLEYVIGKRDGL